MIANLQKIQLKTEKSKIESFSPYDYMKSICMKEPLTEEQLARFETDYQPYVINRWLLPFFPGILQLNMSGDLPKKFHYEYLYRFVKKMSYVPAMDLKSFKIDEKLKLIMKFYRVAYEEAKLLNNFISKGELKEIRDFFKNN